jgi:V/A-type H+-transporting ATPase subunit I
MIVRMSKIEIAGPRELLQEVLAILHESGILHIEPSTTGFIEKKDEEYIDSFLPDKNTFTERFYLEDLKIRIDELLSYLLPALPRKSYIEPGSIIDTINETLDKHLCACRKMRQDKELLQKEQAELIPYSVFLDAIEPLFGDLRETPDIDFIGLTLREPDARSLLREALMLQTDGKFEILTSTASDGTIAGLIAAQKGMSGKIKKTLSDMDMPELTYPPSIGDLTFVEKVGFLRNRSAEISSEVELIDMQMESLSVKWGPLYKSLREWLEERLSLFRATASVFETKMCFLIYGWMASEQVNRLRERLNQDFSGRVVIEEIELHEEDLARIPVLLKNPSYFKPFELLTRILPLPQYTSYDPTPFIGIFFPVFFGMILGDAGYGLILIIISLLLYRHFKNKDMVKDASRILLAASLYSLLFGILYGEFFGELGHDVFGITPVLIERRTAVIPMLYFAVTVGVVHILLGYVLGLSAACKRKSKKEALCKLFSICIIICIFLLPASLFGLFPDVLIQPIVLSILVLSPLLLFTGGLLAPLELLKSIGNIISYARIMAIGLTSVLLAFVANRLAGMTGDIVVGIVVAGLIHLLNIVIGVFSPTIHSLRLHYVEFFSKFIEYGGRKFEPFKKESHVP